MNRLHSFTWKDTSGVIEHASNMYGRRCSIGMYHFIVSPFRQDLWFFEFWYRLERLASGTRSTPESAQYTCEALWIKYLQTHPENEDMYFVGLNNNDIYESTIELYRWDESDKYNFNTYAELEIGKAWSNDWKYQVNIAGPRGSGEMGPLVGYFAKFPSRAEALKAGKDRLKERCAMHMEPELARKAYDAIITQIDDKAQLELF